MSAEREAFRVATRPGALAAPAGPGPACAGFAELGLIHWVAGDSLARVSARAQRLLGGPVTQSLVSLEQLWAAVDPIDRVALSRAANSAPRRSRCAFACGSPGREALRTA